LIDQLYTDHLGASREDIEEDEESFYEMNDDGIVERILVKKEKEVSVEKSEQPEEEEEEEQIEQQEVQIES
jgi:hypothetical protein